MCKQRMIRVGRSVAKPRNKSPERKTLAAVSSVNRFENPSRTKTVRSGRCSWSEMLGGRRKMAISHIPVRVRSADRFETGVAFLIDHFMDTAQAARR